MTTAMNVPTLVALAVGLLAVHFHSGPWQAQAAISCPNQPTSLSNGSIPVYGLLYPNNITYQCNPGYYVGGQANESVTKHVSLCQKNATWSSNAPVCKGVTCSVPPSANGSSYLMRNNATLAYPRSAVYVCVVGFYVGGQADQLLRTKTLQCRPNGTWTSPPTCLRVMCPGLAAPSNGSISFTNKLLYLSVATFRCQSGYRINGAGNSVNTRNLTCRSDRTWNQKTPSCALVRCSGLSRSLTNGTVSGNGRAYQRSRKYTCAPGFYIKSSGDYSVTQLTLTCLATALWSASVPTCSPVSCPQPAAMLTNGKVIGNNVTYGKMYTFVCKGGFYITGSAVSVTNSTIQCQANRTWTGSPPTCSAIICKPIVTSIANGSGSVRQATSPTRRPGFSIVYRCFPGFYIANSAGDNSLVVRLVVCQLNGTWNGTVPMCTVDDAHCTNLTSIPKRKIAVSDGLRIQSTATYSCSSGYTLTGNTQRTCQKNKTWTGTTPACINVDECSTRVDTCNRVNGSCLDSNGSYSCACLTGYTGDGRTCTVVCSERCLAGQGYCTAPDHCDCVRGYSGAICQNLWSPVGYIGDVAASSSLTTTKPTGFSATDGDHHPGRCAVACFQIGFVFAGMFDTVECVCTKIDVRKRLLVNSQPVPCPGAISYSCGNNRSISFYVLQPLPPFGASIASANAGTLLQSGRFFVRERTPLVIICKVAAGNLFAHYDWQKDGRNQSSNPVLYIPTASPADSGSYMCNVSGTGIPTSPNYTLTTSVVVTASVEVQFPPGAFVRAPGVQVAEGMPFSVTCTSSGSAAVRLRWQKLDSLTGRAATLPPRAARDTTDGDLVISRVLQADGGTYRCTANDSTIVFPQIRTSTADVTLTVTGGDACAGECHANASECVRVTGLCQCQAGFTGNGYTTCNDIEECFSAPCFSNSTCVNSLGSYSCRPLCSLGANLERCTQEQDAESDDGDVGAVAGAAAGGVLVIALVALFVVFLHRRKRKRASMQSSQLLIQPPGQGVKMVENNEYELPSPPTHGPPKQPFSRQMFQNAERNGGFGKSAWSAAAYYGGGEGTVTLLPNGQPGSGGGYGVDENLYDAVIIGNNRDCGPNTSMVQQENTYDTLQREHTEQPAAGSAVVGHRSSTAMAAAAVVQPSFPRLDSEDLYDRLQVAGKEPSLDNNAVMGSENWAAHDALTSRSSTTGPSQAVNRVMAERAMTTTLGAPPHRRPSPPARPGGGSAPGGVPPLARRARSTTAGGRSSAHPASNHPVESGNGYIWHDPQPVVESNAHDPQPVVESNAYEVHELDSPAAPRHVVPAPATAPRPVVPATSASVNEPIDEDYDFASPEIIQEIRVLGERRRSSAALLLPFAPPVSDGTDGDDVELYDSHDFFTKGKVDQVSEPQDDNTTDDGSALYDRVDVARFVPRELPTTTPDAQSSVVGVDANGDGGITSAAASSDTHPVAADIYSVPDMKRKTSVRRKSLASEEKLVLPLPESVNEDEDDRRELPPVLPLKESESTDTAAAQAPEETGNERTVSKVSRIASIYGSVASKPKPNS